MQTTLGDCIVTWSADISPARGCADVSFVYFHHFTFQMGNFPPRAGKTPALQKTTAILLGGFYQTAGKCKLES